MISGRSRLFTYAAVDTLKPGHSSSVTHAPPTTSRRSSTSTRLPARASALVGLTLAAFAASTAGSACPTRSARSTRAATVHEPREQRLVDGYHNGDAAAPAPGPARSTVAAVAPRGARLRGASRRARRAVRPVPAREARAAATAPRLDDQPVRRSDARRIAQNVEGRRHADLESGHIQLVVERRAHPRESYGHVGPVAPCLARAA